MLNCAANWYILLLQMIQKAPLCLPSSTTQAARLRWEMPNPLIDLNLVTVSHSHPWEFLSTLFSHGHLGDVYWGRGECDSFSFLTKIPHTGRQSISYKLSSATSIRPREIERRQYSNSKVVQLGSYFCNSECHSGQCGQNNTVPTKLIANILQFDNLRTHWLSSKGDLASGRGAMASVSLLLVYPRDIWARNSSVVQLTNLIHENDKKENNF